MDDRFSGDAFQRCEPGNGSIHLRHIAIPLTSITLHMHRDPTLPPTLPSLIMHPAYRGMRTVVRHLTLCASSAILVLAACKREQAAIRPDAAFTPYIPAFTAGHIPARGPLLIRIADGQSWKDTSAAALQDLFDLDPGAKGTVTWYDANTLAFRPDERLDQNTVYTVGKSIFDRGKSAILPLVDGRRSVIPPSSSSAATSSACVGRKAHAFA